MALAVSGHGPASLAATGQILLAARRLDQYRCHDDSECQPGGEDRQLELSRGLASITGQGV